VASLGKPDEMPMTGLDMHAALHLDARGASVEEYT
tara:strand:+ start:658 stop:762 length:105 start_codon:yes stop_codon:yes gene_type:complete